MLRESTHKISFAIQLKGFEDSAYWKLLGGKYLGVLKSVSSRIFEHPKISLYLESPAFF